MQQRERRRVTPRAQPPGGAGGLGTGSALQRGWAPAATHQSTWGIISAEQHVPQTAHCPGLAAKQAPPPPPQAQRSVLNSCHVCLPRCPNEPPCVLQWVTRLGASASAGGSGCSSAGRAGGCPYAGPAAAPRASLLGMGFCRSLGSHPPLPPSQERMVIKHGAVLLKRSRGSKMKWGSKGMPQALCQGTNKTQKMRAPREGQGPAVRVS